MSRRNRPDWLNPPPHRQLSDEDEEFLDAISTAYNESVDKGEIQGDVIVVPEIKYEEPSIDGFVNFVENDLHDFIKTEVAQEVSDLVDYTADRVASFNGKVLPSTSTTIAAIGVVAFFGALGLIVAGKHL